MLLRCIHILLLTCKYIEALNKMTKMCHHHLGNQILATNKLEILLGMFLVAVEANSRYDTNLFGFQNFRDNRMRLVLKVYLLLINQSNGVILMP